MQTNSLRKPITTSQNLALGALAYTTSIGRRSQLLEIVFHFSAAVTETVTISIDSRDGANYDTVKRSRDLVAATDYVYRPDGEETLYAGDELKIAITNANTTGIAYVTIKTKELLQ